MSWWYVGATAVSVVGGAINSNQQKKAAQGAANSQKNASNASIAESGRQFDAIRELLRPYTDVGSSAVNKQGDLMGLNGDEAQKAAVDAIQNGPQFQSMAQQGENSILQNASATGGLRGGNIQASLAQFRPNLLAQTIQQQYQNLGGLTSVGQNAAAGVGNAGMWAGNQNINALNQIGAANAGQALANGNANANLTNNIARGAMMYMGSKM